MNRILGKTLESLTGGSVGLPLELRGIRFTWMLCYCSITSQSSRVVPMAAPAPAPADFKRWLGEEFEGVFDRFFERKLRNSKAVLRDVLYEQFGDSDEDLVRQFDNCFFTKSESSLRMHEHRDMWAVPFIRNVAAECLHFITGKQPQQTNAPYVFRTKRFDDIIDVGPKTPQYLGECRETLDRVLLHRNHTTHSPDMQSLKRKLVAWQRLVDNSPEIQDQIVDQRFVFTHAEEFFVNFDEKRRAEESLKEQKSLLQEKRLKEEESRLEELRLKEEQRSKDIEAQRIENERSVGRAYPRGGRGRHGSGGRGRGSGGRGHQGQPRYVAVGGAQPFGPPPLPVVPPTGRQ